MRTPEEKKAAQAAAHKKWRLSEKGKAYAEKVQKGRKKPEAKNEQAS
jgi:hypothetical protein